VQNKEVLYLIPRTIVLCFARSICSNKKGIQFIRRSTWVSTMLFVEATTKRDGLTTYLSRCPISPTYLYSRASNNHPAYKMSISQIYQNMPATIKLLKAFSRWQRKDNSYQKKAVGHNDPRFLEDHQLEPYAPVPPPAAVHFVSSLSPVVGIWAESPLQSNLVRLSAA